MKNYIFQKITFQIYLIDMAIRGEHHKNQKVSGIEKGYNSN